MTLGALLVFAFAAVTLALAFDRERRRERALERRERAWETERKDLLDRIMYLSDHTWTIPPADHSLATAAPERVDPNEPISYDPLYTLPNEIA